VAFEQAYFFGRFCPRRALSQTEEAIIHIDRARLMISQQKKNNNK